MTLNRRQLLTGGAAVVAHAIARPVLAAVSQQVATPAFDYSKIPIEKIELIERALDISQLHPFTHAEQRALFGWYPFVAGTFAELRDLTHEFGLISRDVWERVRCIVAIQNKLDELFPGDLAGQWKRLQEPFVAHLKTSVREAMTTDLFTLPYAAKALGCDISDMQLS